MTKSRTLIFEEHLTIDNGSVHHYDYKVYQFEGTNDFELIRFAYGALQGKNPYYRGLERVLFEINADKAKKIRFLQGVVNLE